MLFSSCFIFTVVYTIYIKYMYGGKIVMSDSLSSIKEPAAGSGTSNLKHSGQQGIQSLRTPRPGAPDFDPLLVGIMSIVRSAGELINHVDTIANMENDCAIKQKEGPANFVTKYDSMVQSYLIEHLSALLPGAAYVGEEDGLSEAQVGDGYTFILDPIDGTTNFICNFMCSGISVGLAYQREMLIGVVYNPFRDEMFYAQKGMGSFLNGHRLSLKDGLLNTGVVNFGMVPYNPELRDFTFNAAKLISYHTMDLREIGSAAVGLCYTACGRCAAYASPRLYVWDYAAASLIITEANGVITSFDGTPLAYRSGISIIASNRQGQEEFLKLIKPLL